MLYKHQSFDLQNALEYLIPATVQLCGETMNQLAAEGKQLHNIQYDNGYACLIDTKQHGDVVLVFKPDADSTHYINKAYVQ